VHGGVNLLGIRGPGKLTVPTGFRYLQRQMTPEEIYESVTNGGASDFATVAEILGRHGIAEAHPQLRHLIPNEIVSQLGGGGT
jgi:hypothetical protein